MNWQTSSALVILIAPFLIGAYDLLAYWMAGNEATISRVCLEAAWARPVYQWSVCFLFGVLCAHLFAPTLREPPIREEWSLAIFVIIPLFTIGILLLLGVREPDPAVDLCHRVPLTSVIVWLCAGVLIGGIFLPQSM